MRVFVVGVVGTWIAAGARLASGDADPPITVRSAPPETSWYAAVAPAAAPSVSTRAQFHRGVARGGLVVLGGITRTRDDNFARIDLGVPTSTSTFRRMRTFITAELSTGEDALGARTASTRDIVVAPTLQYDWRLPFTPAGGDVVLVAGAGLSWQRHYVRLPDEPFWPESWESTDFYSVRFELAVQYRSASGLIISVHAPTATVPFNHPDPPDARWMQVDSKAHYAASVVAGYQFQ